MKTLLKCKAFTMIMILSIGFFSCSKDEIGSTENTAQEEVYNMTEHNDSNAKDGVELEGEVLFSKEYDESLSNEEVFAQFDKDVKQFFIDNPQIKKVAKSTEWFFTHGAKTGSQTYNNSSGKVQSRVYFKTNRGYSWVGYNLPPGSAKKAGWKLIFSRGWYPGHKTISYVKPYKHRVSLQGTDEWFVTEVSVGLAPHSQSIAATGYSGIIGKPYKWLKSNSTYGWSHLYQTSGSFGQTNF